MKYAFVFISIAAIWVSTLIMATLLSASDIMFVFKVALALSLVLFWIGFGARLKA